MSEALGFTIIMVASLTGMFLVLLSFTLLVRYSFEEHHLRVKLFSMFCIRSIPFRQLREVRVVQWWKEFSLEIRWAERWPSHAFKSECVLITIGNSMCPYVFLSPLEPATFATTLSSRIPNAESTTVSGCQAKK
jgi:hypothetical protein